MFRRTRVSTKPAFPELLAQQTIPFDRNAPVAAFLSLPLTNNCMTVSTTLPFRIVWALI